MRKKLWAFFGAVPLLTTGCGLTETALPTARATAVLGPVQHATRVVGTRPRVVVSSEGVNLAINSIAGNALSLTYQLPKHSRVRIVYHGMWRIRVILPQHVNGIGTAYLHVQLPLKSSLHGSASGGNLSVQGVYRGVWLYSTGGNVNGSHLTTGTLVAQSQGGGVSASWSTPPSSEKIESGGGNISVTGPWSQESLFSSGGGNIRVTGHPTVRTIAHLNAVGGSISSGFSSLPATNGMTGDETVTIASSVPTSKSGTLVVNAAGGNISVKP